MHQSTRLLTSTSLICSLLLAVSGTTAVAQNSLPLPEGQTLISLSVTERTRVGQDTLTAELRIEVDDRDPAVVQDRINTTMADALALTRGHDGVSVATGYYGIYQYNRNPSGNRADEMWRGSQSISLESLDSAQVLALAGELQAKGFLMNQLTYSLSTERADEVRDSLMEAALTRAQQKAERAGRALGKTDVELATVEIDARSDGYAPPVMMRAMADTSASMEMTTPGAEAGETDVTLTVRVQAVAR